MRRLLRTALPIAGLAAFAALVPLANAQTVVRNTTLVAPHRAAHTTVVVDRSRTGWWRGQPDFVAYQGPRRGYAYAPGYGYYPVTYAPRGGVWVVGSHYPAAMRRYVVVSPARYGLPVAPRGHAWYYAGNNFVLVRQSTWVVTRTVAGGW